MTEYEIVNSAEFLDSIRAVGPGARMLKANTVKKRFDPAINRGAASISHDGQALIIRWDQFSNWTSVTHDVGDGETATHYGILHFVAPLPNGRFSYRVEDLRRPGEAAGTRSVKVEGWPFARDVWGVMLYDKNDSPVRNRSRSCLSIRSARCGLEVGTACRDHGRRNTSAASSFDFSGSGWMAS